MRSVTPVNEQLLGGSSVRFVGTATIGLDHLDTGYLQANNIRYVNAPGCNANSVVEYVLSVLVLLAEFDQFRIQDKTVGIIGYAMSGSYWHIDSGNSELSAGQRPPLEKEEKPVWYH